MAKTQRDYYDIQLRSCIYKYLIKLQGDNLGNNAIQYLKTEWGKAWIKEKSNANVILHTAFMKDTYNNLRNFGIRAIIFFGDLISKDKHFPIIINKNYEYEIGGVKVRGVFEYISEIERNGETVFQVYHFNTLETKMATKDVPRNNIILLSEAHAFMDMFGQRNFELVSVDLFNEKVYTSIMTKELDLMLKRTVCDAAKCMKMDINIKSPDSKCFHCEIRNRCL